MRSHYIGQPIEVEFDTPPRFSKRPHRPDRLIWDGQTHTVVESLEEHVDFGRRGRMASNMQPEHAARAAEHGSWGVGRYFFTVRTSGNRIFEIVYDRAPRDVDDRSGSWFLRLEWLPE